MATPKRFFSKNGLCRSLFFFLKAFALSFLLSLFFSSHAGTIKKLEGKKNALLLSPFPSAVILSLPLSLTRRKWAL